MGFKEFMESFKKKYRNADLYLMFDQKAGTSCSSRMRKNKTYCRVVIKNKTGSKIKIINGGQIINVKKHAFVNNYCEYEAVYSEDASFRLVPLKMLGIKKRTSEIIFDFTDFASDVIPNDLYRFCDIHFLGGKYVSADSLVSNILTRNEKAAVLSEKQIASFENFINEAIHERLKEGALSDKREQFKREQLNKEKIKKQKRQEELDKERDF